MVSNPSVVFLDEPTPGECAACKVWGWCGRVCEKWRRAVANSFSPGLDARAPVTTVKIAALTPFVSLLFILQLLLLPLFSCSHSFRSGCKGGRDGDACNTLCSLHPRQSHSNFQLLPTPTLPRSGRKGSRDGDAGGAKRRSQRSHRHGHHPPAQHRDL